MSLVGIWTVYKRGYVLPHLRAAKGLICLFFVSSNFFFHEKFMNLGRWLDMAECQPDTVVYHLGRKQPKTGLFLPYLARLVLDAKVEDKIQLILLSSPWFPFFFMKN